MSPEESRRAWRQHLLTHGGLIVQNLRSNAHSPKLLDAPLTNQPIDSKEYVATKILGEGHWGVVYEFKRQSDGEVFAGKVPRPSELAKKQMEERGWSSEHAVNREGFEDYAGAHVAPNTRMTDDSGRVWWRMRVYDGTLEDRLQFYDSSKKEYVRRYLGYHLNHDQVENILMDISEGLKEIHRLSRFHGDLKESNLFFNSDDSVVIGDHGASTSIQTDPSKRYFSRGELYTRMPQHHVSSQKPTEINDVWAFGSLAYKLVTGKYVFEEEINRNAPQDFFNSLLTEDGDLNESYFNLIKQKLKMAPRRYRSLLEQCFNLNLANGYELSHAMKEHIKKYDFKSNMRSIVKSATKNLLVIAGVVAITSGFLNTLPGVEHYRRSSDPFVRLSKAPSEFNIIPIKSEKTNPKYVQTHQSVIDLVANNGIEAYNETGRLAFSEASLNINAHLLNGSPLRSSFIDHTIRDLTTYGFQIAHIPSSREDAYHNSSPGSIDLEDALVIATMGQTTLREAQLLSGSRHFKEYSLAQYADGSRVIDEKKRTFLVDWRDRVIESLGSKLLQEPDSHLSVSNEKPREYVRK